MVASPQGDDARLLQIEPIVERAFGRLLIESVLYTVSNSEFLGTGVVNATFSVYHCYLASAGALSRFCEPLESRKNLSNIVKWIATR